MGEKWDTNNAEPTLILVVSVSPLPRSVLTMLCIALLLVLLDMVQSEDIVKHSTCNLVRTYILDSLRFPTKVS